MKLQKEAMIIKSKKNWGILLAGILVGLMIREIIRIVFKV